MVFSFESFLGLSSLMRSFQRKGFSDKIELFKPLILYREHASQMQILSEAGTFFDGRFRYAGHAVIYFRQ